jgi:hypothetical protein
MDGNTWTTVDGMLSVRRDGDAWALISNRTGQVIGHRPTERDAKTFAQRIEDDLSY